MNFDLWAALFFGAAFHGYLLSAALFFAKERKQGAAPFFALLILSVSLMLTDIILARSGFYFYDRNYQVIFITIPFSLLQGPLYYFYLRSVLDGNARLRLIDVLHFLPAVACALNYLPFFHTAILYGLGLRDSISGAHFFLIDINGYAYMAAHLGLAGVYIIAGYRLLQTADQQLRNRLTGAAPGRLRRLKQLSALFWGTISLLLAAMLFLILKTHIPEVEYGMALTLAATVQVIGYGVIRQPEVFSGKPLSDIPEKYRNSALTEQQASAYVERLLQYMENEEPFLDSDLKLPDLASALSISPHHLSQLINQGLQTNFFDFVNRYRVKAAQQKLLDPGYRHLTLLGIALEAGFNNKSSFNRAFKKHTGMTPGEFVRTHNRYPVRS